MPRVAGEAARQGLCVEKGMAGGEKLEKKRKKEAKHKQRSIEGKDKEEAAEKSIPRPTKATSAESSRMEKEWAVVGRAAKL